MYETVKCPPPAAAPLSVSRQRDRDAGKYQHDAGHRKGIGETHDQRLPLDGVAKRNEKKKPPEGG